MTMAETNGQEHETDVNGTGERRPQISGKLAYQIGREIEVSGALNGKYWEYQPGKSDETIAKLFDIETISVARFRKQAFGPMKKGWRVGGHDNVTLRSQVKMLQRRVDILETTIAELLMRK